MAQSEYGDIPCGIEGQIVEGQLNNTVSRVNTSEKPLSFGKGVFCDGDSGAKLGTISSKISEFVGVTVRDDTCPDGIPATCDYGVMTMGVIWVTALEKVTNNDPAFVRIGTNGTGSFSNANFSPKKGCVVLERIFVFFRALAGANATLSLAIPKAKFISSGEAGDLVQLSIGVGG